MKSAAGPSPSSTYAIRPKGKSTNLRALCHEAASLAGEPDKSRGFAASANIVILPDVIVKNPLRFMNTASSRCEKLRACSDAFEHKRLMKFSARRRRRREDASAHAAASQACVAYAARDGFGARSQPQAQSR